MLLSTLKEEGIKPGESHRPCDPPTRNRRRLQRGDIDAAFSGPSPWHLAAKREVLLTPSRLPSAAP